MKHGLVLWVGDQDMSRVKPLNWPLARTGQVSLFKPFPFGTDQRGRTVPVTLMYENALIGAMPGMGNGYGAIDAPRNTSPLELAERFCAARTSGDMAGVATFFAPKLRRLVAGRPDAQVPWQGLPDRPLSCALEVLNGYDDTVGVLVRITYEAPQHSWSDVLNLERTPDSWWINNVFYEGGGNLRFRLVQSE